MVLTCPNCGLLSPEGAQRCDCGFDYVTGKNPHTGRPPGVTAARLTRFALGSVLLPVVLLRMGFAVGGGQGSPVVAGMVAGVCIGAANLRWSHLGIWSSTLAIVAYGMAAVAMLFGLAFWIACGTYGSCP